MRGTLPIQRFFSTTENRVGPLATHSPVARKDPKEIALTINNVGGHVDWDAGAGIGGPVNEQLDEPQRPRGERDSRPTPQPDRLRS